MTKGHRKRGPIPRRAIAVDHGIEELRGLLIFR